MTPALSGIETEYGLAIAGRGAGDQVEDAAALVRSYPGPCFVGWDYRHESPRADLRGFKVRALAYDPEDAKFDEGKTSRPVAEVRADRILPNGARLYNDHGHPEYSTPECRSIFELALHDLAGQTAVLSAARAYAAQTGLAVSVYKNNTDFHGASYGTHESYLAPRALGFDKVYRAVMPILLARQILTGAGKVGAETGRSVTYQISQRADFFSEGANVETLFRRPVFNTRDEPHSDPDSWMRVHVISGDANMMPAATALKVGLVRLALQLAEVDAISTWEIPDPAGAFRAISRDERYQFPIQLGGKNWTTAYEVLEELCSAAERNLPLDDEQRWVITRTREMMEDLTCNFPRFKRRCDWAAKRAALEQYLDSEGTDWRDPSLQSFDLEYHNVDPEQSLYWALVEMDEVEAPAPEQDVQERLSRVFEPTRARARSVAVSKFHQNLVTAGWRSLVMRNGESELEVDLSPVADYPAQLEQAEDVGTFIGMLRGQK